VGDYFNFKKKRGKILIGEKRGTPSRGSGVVSWPGDGIPKEKLLLDCGMGTRGEKKTESSDFPVPNKGWL